MTAESIVPGLVHRIRPADVPAVPSVEVAGLPLPRLVTLPSERPMLYGMAALDGGGRIGDRRILHALGWPPAQPLNITLSGDAVLVQPNENGTYHRPPGLLALLPAPIRHWCRLSPGDRVLLVADGHAGPGDGNSTANYVKATLQEVAKALAEGNAGGSGDSATGAVALRNETMMSIDRRPQPCTERSRKIPRLS